jgi:putative sigma-54 modulation protein
MNLKTAYRHLESTPSIEEKIQRKAKKLKKYFNGKIDVDWTCSVEKGKHCSEVKVSGDSFTFHATAEDANLYHTFDGVLNKLEKQLSKKKDQMKDKMHRKGSDVEFYETE